MKMKVRFVINHFGSTKAKFFTTTMLTTGDRLNISIEVIILFLKYWRNKLIFLANETRICFNSGAKITLALLPQCLHN